MGLLHKVARNKEIDRIENYMTTIIVRTMGYFYFGQLNAVDDVLRKLGSTHKTFPNDGCTALQTDEQQELMIFRAICNHHTK